MIEKNRGAPFDYDRKLKLKNEKVQPREKRICQNWWQNFEKPNIICQKKWVQRSSCGTKK